MLNTIASLSRLKPNWDSYRSVPMTSEALATAEVMTKFPGQLVPCSNGGIQIEWHVGHVDVEIVILPDGTIEQT